MNVKKWLTEEEKGIYQSYLDYLSNLDEHPERSQAFTDAIAVAKTFLESLAACRELSETRRALLEKHQWVWDKDKEHYECVDCGKTYPMGTLDWNMKHVPDCAWDAVLKGTKEE